jgi:hypothetical protein
MDALDAWIVAVVAVLATFAVVLALRRLGMRRRNAATTQSPPPGIVVRAEDHRVVALLDIEGAEPNAAPVRRLVREVAARVFRVMPTAEEVEVRSGVGALLGVVGRTSAGGRGAPAPEVMLLEPHVPRSRGPDLSAHLWEQEQDEPPVPVPPVAPTFSLPPSPPHPFADRFDLTEEIRSRIVDADDPVGLVRAILEAAGIEVEVDEDLLRAGEVAVVVIDPHGVSVPREMLNHAFIRIERSGASRGLVIGLGVLDVDDVRRREMWAPHILHSGREGIQRMADAVAVGADPLRFAAAPALTLVGGGSAIGWRA